MRQHEDQAPGAANLVAVDLPQPTEIHPGRSYTKYAAHGQSPTT